MNGAIRHIGQLYLLLVMLFMLGPLLVVMLDSFNSATSFPSPFEQPTLRWYRALLRHREFLRAMLISLEVALAAGVAATIAGCLAAYGLTRHEVAARYVIATVLIGPLFIPEMVIALAILQLTNELRLELGLFTLVAVHSVFVMPFAFRLLLARFGQIDFGIEDAARSLGASRPGAIWHIILPQVSPSLVAAFVLATTLSFVNLPLSMFLTTPSTTTLPVIVFAFMESRIDPLIAAVASLVVIVAVAVALVLDRVLRVKILG